MCRLIKTAALITTAFLLMRFPIYASQPDLAYEFSGEASGWTLGSLAERENSWNIGARYIPSFSLTAERGSGDLFDAYIYLNGFVGASSIDDYDNYDLELYRLVARYATSRTETRIGLQKISFGPAVVLRSLMWFDSIDPRDPQQLTSGVWAMKFRYDGLDNSSLWLWTIIPEDERKGLEIIPSEKGNPELGGRYVRPVPAGEMALTVNTRRAEVPGTGLDFRENRVAIDGRWDVEVGLWFEAALQHQSDDLIPMQWRKMLTAGTDYTLGIGNGLYVVLEHMGIFMSSDLAGNDEDFQTTAWMANYQMGLIDNLSAIGFYSWRAEKYYQYLAWQRTWDSWILHISAFHYPETDVTFSPFGTTQPVTGTGGQVLVIFNH
jgi:hypothetical protein